jgi:hypothetical protein
MDNKKRFTGPGDLQPVNRITMMRTFACATKVLVQNVTDDLKFKSIGLINLDK